MSDTENKIRQIFAEGDVCLGHDIEYKTYFKMVVGETYYGISDVYAEKSTTSQFVFQPSDGPWRPMSEMEFNLFMNKVKEKLDAKTDVVFRTFHIGTGVERLENDFVICQKNDHWCMRDLREYSENNDWSLEMHKNGLLYKAQIGKTGVPNTFMVGTEPMNGAHFLDLIDHAQTFFSHLNQTKLEHPRIVQFKNMLDVFEDHYITFGRKRIRMSSPKDVLPDQTNKRE